MRLALKCGTVFRQHMEKVSTSRRIASEVTPRAFRKSVYKHFHLYVQSETSVYKEQGTFGFGSDLANNLQAPKLTCKTFMFVCAERSVHL